MDIIDQCIIKHKKDILILMGFTVLYSDEKEYFDIRLDGKSFVIRKTLHPYEFIKTDIPTIVKAFTDEVKEKMVLIGNQHDKEENKW